MILDVKAVVFRWLVSVSELSLLWIRGDFVLIIHKGYYCLNIPVPGNHFCFFTFTYLIGRCGNAPR